MGISITFPLQRNEVSLLLCNDEGILLLLFYSSQGKHPHFQFLLCLLVYPWLFQSLRLRTCLGKGGWGEKGGVKRQEE